MADRTGPKRPTWTVRAVPASRARFVLFPSVGEYPVYDDAVYDAFDARDDRLLAYRAAVRAAAPGRTVLDIGTGRDALWAIEAARAGARHVHAIEAHGAAAAGAARAVAAAGLTDRITVRTGLSTEHTLPVPAEVCVSEIVGNIASAEGMIATLADARARLCAPDCTWIPFRARTMVAAVDLTATEDLTAEDPATEDPAAEDPAAEDPAAEDPVGGLPFAVEGLPYLHAVFNAVGRPFDLRLCLGGPAAEAVISTTEAVESLVFDGRGDPPGDDETIVELRVHRPSRLTGLVLWARVATTSGTGAELDCLTGTGRGWAPVLVPLPAAPRVDRGDRIGVSFRRRTGDDGRHPDFEVTAGGHPPWHGTHHGTRFGAHPTYRQWFRIS